MKKKLYIAVISFIAAAGIANASIIDKKQDVLPFTSINVEDPFEIILKQGSSYSTVMKLDSRVADYCRLYVEGTTLHVELNKSAYPKELKSELNKSKSALDLKVEVTVPSTSSFGKVVLGGKAKLCTAAPFNKTSGKISFELLDEASLYNADFAASRIELSASNKAFVDAKFNSDDVDVSAINNSQVNLKLSGKRSSLTVNGFAKTTVSSTSTENYLNIDGAGTRTTFTGKTTLLSVNAKGMNNNLEATGLDADNVKVVAKSSVVLNVKALKTISFDVAQLAKVVFDGPAVIDIVKIDGASVFRAGQNEASEK